MLYPICPTCGSLLANVQLPYQKDMTELCEKYGVDHESLSHGSLSQNTEFIKEKERIVSRYVDRMCCKARLTNFSDVARIINY